MNIIKKWFLKRLSINDLCWYFHDRGIEIDMVFAEKQLPVYSAKNSKMYKRTFNKESGE